MLREPIIIDDPAPNMDFGGDFNLRMDGLRIGSPQPLNRDKETPTPSGVEAAAGDNPQAAPQFPMSISASQQLSPTSFARQFLSQEGDMDHEKEGMPIPLVEQQNKASKKRKLKRVKPLVDTKLELSNDELKVSIGTLAYICFYSFFEYGY
jgi:hypothetical protein